VIPAAHPRPNTPTNGCSSGYHRKFFISHNPEAWALADVVLDTAGLGVG